VEAQLEQEKRDAVLAQELQRQVSHAQETEHDAKAALEERDRLLAK